MSEDRKECHKCLNFNKCNENVSYESNYCNAHRKQKCDKNVANIEKLIKEYKTYNDLGGIQDLSIYVNALENILAEREQDKKRIQELEESRKKIKKYIKHLEQKESILDKVTDKLKEDIENADNNIKHMEEKNILQAIAKELAVTTKDYAKEILNIIEGNKDV